MENLEIQPSGGNNEAKNGNKNPNADNPEANQSTSDTPPQETPAITPEEIEKKHTEEEQKIEKIRESLGISSEQPNINNEMDLNQNETKGEQPEVELLRIFKDAGVDIINEEKALNVLSSPDFLDKDRDEVFKELGFDKESLSEDQIRQIVRNNAVQIYARIAEKSFRETVKKIDIESYFNSENIIIRSKYGMDTNEDEVSQHLKNVVSDQNSQFRCGYHWNVLISEACPYVLKFIKYNDSALHSAEEQLQNYPIMRSLIGEEFFTQQTVIGMANTERQVILQEKLDPKEWSPLSAYQEVLENLSNSVKQSENKAKLDRFLAGTQRLFKEKGLLVDVLGDNVFYRIDDHGNLDIKLIDYGCLDPKDSVRTEKFLSGLEKL